jgi:hypothetical protein
MNGKLKTRNDVIQTKSDISTEFLQSHGWELGRPFAIWLIETKFWDSYKSNQLRDRYCDYDYYDIHDLLIKWNSISLYQQNELYNKFTHPRRILSSLARKQVRVRYPVWGGTIRRAYLIEVREEIATLEGNWILLSNGCRKRITSKGVTFVRI